MKNKFATFCYELTSVFVIAVILLTIVFTFFVRTVQVVGESMQNTLVSGDWVLVSQMDFGYEPHYGDVVVVYSEGLSENIIKRVIATEGQTITVDDSGSVYVVSANGQGVIDESLYLGSTGGASDIEYPCVIPEGYCFVMGDNRANSIDSRRSIVGLIKNDEIIGHATYAVTDDGIVSLKYSDLVATPVSE